jgi:hypothetical protein
MRSHETGLEYANTDPSLHYNRIEPQPSMRWHGAWIWCLRHGDEEAAQLVKDHNPTLSYECEGGDHDDCHSPHCECAHHRAATLKVEHAPLKSCAEIESEQEEQEFEASLR